MCSIWFVVAGRGRRCGAGGSRRRAGAGAAFSCADSQKLELLGLNWIIRLLQCVRISCLLPAEIGHLEKRDLSGKMQNLDSQASADYFTFIRGFYVHVPGHLGSGTALAFAC